MAAHQPGEFSIYDSLLNQLIILQTNQASPYQQLLFPPSKEFAMQFLRKGDPKERPELSNFAKNLPPDHAKGLLNIVSLMNKINADMGKNDKEKMAARLHFEELLGYLMALHQSSRKSASMADITKRGPILVGLGMAWLGMLDLLAHPQTLTIAHHSLALGSADMANKLAANPVSRFATSSVGIITLIAVALLIVGIFLMLRHRNRTPTASLAEMVLDRNIMGSFLRGASIYMHGRDKAETVSQIYGRINAPPSNKAEPAAIELANLKDEGDKGEGEDGGEHHGAFH